MFAEKYSKYYDLFNSDKPYKKEIEFVYRWAGKPKTVLDLGCGTANYWQYYPIKTKILGVDKSRAMVELTDGKLFPNFKREIICADVTELNFDSQFDCATALFDVINYIPRHDWWKNIPVKKGGYFIFDIWDKEKVNQDGFIIKAKANGTSIRIITPIGYDGKQVDLKIEIFADCGVIEERHRMYIYGYDDILKF